MVPAYTPAAMKLPGEPPTTFTIPELFASLGVGSSRNALNRALPELLLVKEALWSNLHSNREKAVFLAAAAPHSGAWLAALPITSCGLRLDDEAVRVGVALRLGLRLCVAHDCRCGAVVDEWGSHALVCKMAAARHTRHFAINDIVARSFVSAGVPVAKEPVGILKNSLMRPDGVTLIPWIRGKALAWDATIASSLADSYVEV